MEGERRMRYLASANMATRDARLLASSLRAILDDTPYLQAGYHCGAALHFGASFYLFFDSGGA